MLVAVTYRWDFDLTPFRLALPINFLRAVAFNPQFSLENIPSERNALSLMQVCVDRAIVVSPELHASIPCFDWAPSLLVGFRVPIAKLLVFETILEGLLPLMEKIGVDSSLAGEKLEQYRVNCHKRCFS